MKYLFSSESVCAGHPDKICDQISDSIVDALLKADPQSRVAVETLVAPHQIVLVGEVTSGAQVDYETTARKVIASLGYTDEASGFSEKSPMLVKIHEQSQDIALGVDEGGAGDQGLMFGYACRQTPEFMPLPIMISHRLCKQMDQLSQKYSWLRPDGKAQTTVQYEGRNPVGIDTIVLARPHDLVVSPQELKAMLYREAVLPILSDYGYYVDSNRVIVNGTGKWEVGGPTNDSGLTGRKIIVDTYGGWARHGGGCFSGKDATKVDRSAAYAARWVAKNVVAHGLADECEIQVAYVIGQAEPVSLMVETYGTLKTSEKKLRDFIHTLTNFTVNHMIEKLDLRSPFFSQTAAYGHFGRNEFSWEKVV